MDQGHHLTLTLFFGLQRVLSKHVKHHQNFTEANSNEDQTVAFSLSVKMKSKIGPIPGQGKSW